jgi:hypothetical protein
MSTTDLPVKLGWKKGPDDPRTARMSRYLTAALPAPPAAVDWMSQVTAWPMDGNDRIGDCVFAACAHLVQAWTTYANTPVIIPEDVVVGAYAKVTGYDPRTGAGDNGTISLDALNFWRRRGIGPSKITAYVAVDHTNHHAVKTAINLFGGIFLAAELPRTAATQFDRHRTWTVSRAAAGRRGSWGGHAIHCGAYDEDSLTVSTWGRAQRMTWGFLDTYGAEAYAVVSPAWLGPTGISPVGFDLGALIHDLTQIVGVV